MSVQTPLKSFSSAVPARTNVFLAPFQREFDRLFDQLGAAWDGANEVEVSTRMDIKDTPSALEITVEMPGVDAHDVHVSVEDRVLTISGEKKSGAERNEKDYRVCERSFGAFSRSLTLPGSADVEKMSAVMEKGVLKLVVPKDGGAPTRTIKIESR